MESDYTKSPSQLGEDAKQTGRDAMDSARGYAQEAKETARDATQSIRSSADDAAQLGREALGTAKSYAEDAKKTARQAVDTGKAYAKDAVNAAGRKLGDLRGQVDVAKERGTRYINEEPVRAVMIAAAGGALLTALILAALRSDRSDRRYY
ncbi:conserved hypothetical protein [Burkholderiales bacterium 8X]|nr:conserved hypothetical protein [Burkholderiales bacterium 8X]